MRLSKVHHLRLLLQESCKGQGIGARLAHSQRECLQAPLDQKAGIGIQAAAHMIMQLQDLHEHPHALVSVISGRGQLNVKASLHAPEHAAQILLNPSSQ